MAHQEEPMDVDCIDSEFDNKENTYHHSNVLSCTEKGYEEFDVSELSMKLRYSVTPITSPMSKSYTPQVDSKNIDMDLFNANNENDNLTRSLNSTMTKNDNSIKSYKSLPLQALVAGQFIDGNGNPSILRQNDNAVTDNANITVTISCANDMDENLSLPSTSSSALHTPATTPTKDLKNDGDSPIMRGLKSVLNMFRSSQSPVPPSEGDTGNQHALSPANISENENDKAQAVASTPIAGHKAKDDNNCRRSSPLKDSIVFNDDLEKELSWKDETAVFFKGERIPVHKLFFQQKSDTLSNKPEATLEREKENSYIKTDNMNNSVEYMDITYNDAIAADKTITDMKSADSDNEFLDCETTLNKSVSEVIDDNTKELSTNEMSLDSQKPNLLELSCQKDIETNIPRDVQSFVTITSLNGDGIKAEDKPLGNSKEATGIYSEQKELEVIQEISHAGGDISQMYTADLTYQTEISVKKSDNISVAAMKEGVNFTPQEQPRATHTSVNNIGTSLALPEDDIEIGTKEILAQSESVENIISPKVSSNETKLANTFCKSTENDIILTTITQEVLESHLDTNCKKETLDEEILTENIHNRTETVQDMSNVQTILNNDFYEKLNDETLVESVCEVKTIQDVPKIQKLVGDYDTKMVNYDTPYTESVFVTEPNYLTYDPKMLNKDVSAEKNNETNVTLQDIPNELKLDDIKLLDEEITVNDATAMIQDVFKTQTKLDNNCNTELLHKETVTNDSSVACIISDSKFESLLLTAEVTINDGGLLEPPDHPEELIPENSITNSNVIVMNNKDFIETCNKSYNMSIETKSDQTENIHTFVNENILERVPQSNNPGGSELSTVVSINTALLINGVDKNEEDNIVNSDISDKNNEKEISENVQEKDTIEPIDITMNETFMQIHDLPDLVNQTVTIVDSEENSVKELAMSQDDDEKTICKEINIGSELINITLPQENEECKKHDLEINATSLVMTEDMTCKFDSDKKLPDDPMNHFQTKIESLNIIPSDQNVSNIRESHVDEEIMVSENNSPYVSVTAGSEEVEQNIEEPETTFNKTTNMPSSPPIKSRGYNFNFDDMDDPFGTKTQIKNSPQSITPSMQIECSNDENTNKPTNIAKSRKSNSSDRKKETVNKKMNSSFDVKLKSLLSVDNVNDKPQSLKDKNTSAAVVMNETIEDASIGESMIINSLKTEVDENYIAEHNIDRKDKNDMYNTDVIESTEINKTSIESITSVSNDTKIMPSLEQSVYYSAGTSSTESFKSKNVFNLPEIDDINFNPFASKSKMCQSPLGKFETDNPFATNTKIMNSPATSMIISPQEDSNSEVIIESLKKSDIEKIDLMDKMETELMEKDATANISATTSSSMVTDNQNLTTREVNTEDEDTEEGPFLEADDGFDKILDFNDGDVDMMQFNEIPVQTIDDKTDGELFIDAEAFEFLLNQNKCNVVTDSGKESLFLKFDPLFAKRISSDGVLASLSKYKKKESTRTKPSRVSLKNEALPIAGPSTLNISYDGDHNDSQESNDDMNITVSKPMMVVTPAVNPAVTPRTKPTTPIGSNRRSITFTSPAIAAIDRLLSMSSNNSFMGHDTTITQTRREQSEADLALIQLRELLAEKEISVYNLRTESKELRDRLSTMESQIKILEEDGTQKLNKINELNERLAEKTKINKSMVAIVEEYEWTIASLIAGTEQDKKRNAEERTRLINERDEQVSHLASMEVSFNDLHTKYEKSKQVILACRANEEAYKKTLEDFEANLKKMQSNYELLKQHATSKLNQANQELEKINKSNQAEVVKLNAMIKRKDLHITSLEETLLQKTKANEELTAICDELINKVG